MMYKSFISTFYKMENPISSKHHQSKNQITNISTHNNVQMMSLQNLILVNNNCHAPNEQIFQKNS